MAITSNCVKFLFYSKQEGVSYENSLMLGRMLLYAKPEEIRAQMEKYGMDTGAIDKTTFQGAYAEPVFDLLGARKVESLDLSGYEGAGILHDMNKPIPPELKNRFTMVFDGGTIEHVFNFPICIENCMSLLKVGGHFISIAPCNNHMGHGFYQFSPELYFRVFSEENGFKIKRMFISAVNKHDKMENWYEVNDTLETGERVELINDAPTYLMILAQKISDKKPFESIPQQSDYTSIWKAKSPERPAPGSQVSGVKRIYRKFIPKRLRIFFRNFYDLFFKEKIETTDLGTIDAKHFRKFPGI